jgi:capsular polysaccharide transport system permease protein
MSMPRSSLAVTLSVWKALFLREAVSRLSISRTAAVWILLEPIAHVLFLSFVFTVIRARTMGGIDIVIWLLAGLLSFFMFKRTSSQSANALGPNKALFAYRQIRPVDTVLVRAGLEGFLTILLVLVVFSGAGLFGFAAYPDDPLAVLESMFGLWLFALGLGLVMSVVSELVAELNDLVELLMMPLYLASGVVLPLAAVPHPYREWLLYNPIAHGLEATRLAFSSTYHAVPELSIAYLYQAALVLVFLGLALHARFASRVLAS